jgi:hypothetical protein
MVLSIYECAVFRPAGRKTAHKKKKRSALPKAQADDVSPVNYTSYAVIFRKQFKPAAARYFLCSCVLFLRSRAQKQYTKEQECRSAEGRMPTAQLV